MNWASRTPQVQRVLSSHPKSPHRCLHSSFWPHVPGVQECGMRPRHCHRWMLTHHKESFWRTWNILCKHHLGGWHKSSPCQCTDFSKRRWVHTADAGWLWIASPCGCFPAGGMSTGIYMVFLLCLEASAETAPACVRVHAKIKRLFFPYRNFRC